MNLFRKIKLSGRYWLTPYLVSALVTSAAAVLMFFDPYSLSIFLPIKIFSIPVILYLFILLQKKHDIYFYINLGFSRFEFYAIPIAVDFAVFVLLMIITGSISYAIR